MKKALVVLLKTVIILILVGVVLFSLYKIYMSFEIKGTPSTDMWSEDDVFDPENIETLSMTSGEDFKILLLSDVQLEGLFFTDNKSLELIDELVADIEPDFIMTSGDNAMLMFSDILSEKFVSKMETYKIPWGVVLGNHDSEGRADRTWFGNLYEDAQYSLFQSGPSNLQGIGNYVINIVDENANPVYSMIMMDSNIEREYEDGTYYDYIYPDQIKWYEWVVNGQLDIPSMLVFHIPLPEFNDAIDANEAGSLNTPSFGEIREKVCCPRINTGLFDVAKELGSTTHIFNGHDHVNNLSVDWQGIRMTYGLKTGNCSYSDDDLQGATLITITAETNEVIVEHIYK